MKTKLFNGSKILFALALVAICGQLSASNPIKGNGNVVTRNYEFSAFNEISTVLPATINFTVSKEYACRVQLDENLFEYLDIRLKGNELTMKTVKEGSSYVQLSPTAFVIELSAPSLEEISLVGSGDFVFLTPFEAKDLEISIAGSGDVVFKETARINELEVSIAGSGDVKCDNLIADKTEVSVAGSGDVNIEAGTVRTLEASIAGSGSITTRCQLDRLKYSIAGSGFIYYVGDAKVSGNKVGSGQLRRIDK